MLQRFQFNIKDIFKALSVDLKILLDLALISILDSRLTGLENVREKPSARGRAE